MKQSFRVGDWYELWNHDGMSHSLMPLPQPKQVNQTLDKVLIPHNTNNDILVSLFTKKQEPAYAANAL